MAAAAVPAKGHRDENFPVASVLLRARHRAPIMSFYRFARAADDIADDPDALAGDKLRRLGAMRSGLQGNADGSEDALRLRSVMIERDLDPTHAHELLDAFERDVVVDRYATWQELIDYCRLSAMPVGRFVLDVHHEDRSCWPASDALCAALQIINHLQDCGDDYRTIGRVYIPLEALAATGARAEDLGGRAATPALLATIRGLADRTQRLLHQSAPFAAGIRDRRLAAEVAVIQRLAESLVGRLQAHDPLGGRVHHRPYEAAMLAAGAVVGRLFARRRHEP